MAYSRFFLMEGVFCYKSSSGTGTHFECCACQLVPPQSTFRTAEELFWHVVAHQLQGQEPDDDALQEIYLEAIGEAS